MDGLSLDSRAYFLWNDSLGVVIGENLAQEQTAVASLTKIMTALLTLEHKTLNETVMITPEMVSGLTEFAVIGLQVGQKVSVEDLLYATMLPSAGDAAQALAIATGGSLTEFVNLMNARAAEIGLANTHFNNPVGQDENNYSTPEDIAKLLKVALQNPEFVKIFETFEYEAPTLGRKLTKTFQLNGDLKPFVRGGKTGYTEAAGRCLASTAEIEGARYILVTVGAEQGKNLSDAAKVYQMIAENYDPVKIVSVGEKLVQIGVKASPTRTVDFVAQADATVVLENEIQTSDLMYEYNGATEITSKTPVGETLGTYRIWRGEQELFAQEIVYTEPVEFYHYGWVAFGAAVSLILLVGTVFLGMKVWQQSARRSRRRQKQSEEKKMVQKEAARRQRGWKRYWLVVGSGILGLLFVISLVVNGLIFKDWFAPAGETKTFTSNLVRETDEEVAEASAESEEKAEEPAQPEKQQDPAPVLGNCTMNFGNLMLINPNFTVGQDFITSRKRQLISVSRTYGIPEYKVGNGDNLLTPEAAEHLNAMIKAYEAAHPGHEMGTRSCFRERGTTCGRLCAATGTSDHHTGLTCDLIDQAYGTDLDVERYNDHIEWQWLKENSYKYGFIDRFPVAWAGGSMSQPINVDANGSTGLHETWHYRYVGVEAATEIATGKYNNGQYDSLEHYLKMTGRVKDLKGGGC